MFLFKYLGDHLDVTSDEYSFSVELCIVRRSPCLPGPLCFDVLSLIVLGRCPFWSSMATVADELGGKSGLALLARRFQDRH